MNASNLVYSVRCFAGDGSMMGSILEDNFGKPLTKRTASNLANFENERSERRRSQKLSGAFSYAVCAWDRITLKRFI